jgi:mannitol/fructose-specific phosphotransferase system IIA component (Ntr-type)
MTLWKQFKPKACTVGLSASTKDAALEEVVGNLTEAQFLTRAQSPKVLEALLAREALASTGVGMGVAIPHVKLTGLDQAVFSLSVHKQGLAWDAVDGAPVQVVFTVVRPDRPGDKHDPARHLELMQWIARLSRHADFRSFAVQATTRTQLVELLQEMSAV